MITTTCICDKCQRKIIRENNGPYYNLVATKKRGYFSCSFSEFPHDEYDLCESCFERFREWLNDQN